MVYFDNVGNERVVIVKSIGYGIVGVRNRAGEVYYVFLGSLEKIK